MNWTEKVQQAKNNLDTMSLQKKHDDLVQGQKKENERILYRQNVWKTEIQPAFEILNKIGVKEMLQEINQSICLNKGKINNCPDHVDEIGTRDAYDNFYRSNRFIFLPKDIDQTLHSSSLEYNAAYTLCAKWLICELVPFMTSDTTEGASYELIVENLMVLIGANNSEIVVSNEHLQTPFLTLRLTDFNLNNPSEIDQLKNKITESVAIDLAKKNGYPFDSLSKNAFIKIKEDLDHDVRYRSDKNRNKILKLIPELINGDKIQISDMKTIKKKGFFR